MMTTESAPMENQSTESALKARNLIVPSIWQLRVTRPLDVGEGILIAVVAARGPAGYATVWSKGGDEFVPGSP